MATAWLLMKQDRFGVIIADGGHHLRGIRHASVRRPHGMTWPAGMVSPSFSERLTQRLRSPPGGRGRCSVRHGPRVHCGSERAVRAHLTAARDVVLAALSENLMSRFRRRFRLSMPCCAARRAMRGRATQCRGGARRELRRREMARADICRCRNAAPLQRSIPAMCGRCVDALYLTRTRGDVRVGKCPLYCFRRATCDVI